MTLTQHDRELAALVLRDHADLMDADLLEQRRYPERRGGVPNMEACEVHLGMVSEMRELAHRIEWDE